MITHSDAQVQILLIDLREQCDTVMVAKANLQVTLTKTNDELTAAKARIAELEAAALACVKPADPPPAPPSVSGEVEDAVIVEPVPEPAPVVGGGTP